MDNKKTTIQESIYRIVWKACDIFRGVIEPNQYKDYILTIFFLKYISDLQKVKYHEYLEKYNGDEERANRAMRHESLIVPPNSTFNYLLKNRNASNLGEIINAALIELEDTNGQLMFCEDGNGIFRNIDFNSNILGDLKSKNFLLKKLLVHFSDEEIVLNSKEDNERIGESYMHLIAMFANESRRNDVFFTPTGVSSLLAKLTKSGPGARICDPVCGSGSLLIRAGLETGSNNFSLYGQEQNKNTWVIAIMNILLHGFDNATIRWGDTIRSPKLKENGKLIKFDTVIGHPPFSLADWGIEEAENDPYNRFWRGIPPKSKGDWAFISHMIEVARENTGKVGVIVPHGVLFRGANEKRIRRQIIEENLLEAVIGLPANLFFGTSIPAVILIFNKGKRKKDVLFIDASKEYESTKNLNRLRSEDIDKITTTYKAFTEDALHLEAMQEKYAHVATPDEIQENEFNLNISRYVETFEEEKGIDANTAQAEIDRLEDELVEIQNKIRMYLKELKHK
ncbi:N-6 DNA methylase [Bacteroides sp.]